MEITEVRIKLMDDDQERLLGFCSITFDRAFVVRDMKIIKGSRGAFVAMPSRKLMDRCRNCSYKNPLRSVYCSQCGIKLGENRSLKTFDGKAKLYADIAHPINSECRDMIQQRVLLAYDEELILSRQPDYTSRYDDFGEYELGTEETHDWGEDFQRKEKTLSPDRWETAPEQHAPDEHAPDQHAPDEPPQEETVVHSPPHNNDTFGDGIL